MRKRRTSASAQLLTQLSSLAVSAPQVVAHRVARMAAAGSRPSRTDQKEFVGMVVEKPVAFAMSMQNMWLAAFKANYDFLFAFSRSFFLPYRYTPLTGARLARRTRSAGLSILSKGISPIERKAAANAKRLARTRTR